MKAMFRVALAALICNYMALAVDSAAIIDGAESHEEEEHMGTHDVEHPDPHHSNDSHITINDAELPEGEESTETHEGDSSTGMHHVEHPDHPPNSDAHEGDSVDYQKQMEEIERAAQDSKGAASPKVAHPLEEGMHVAMPTAEPTAEPTDEEENVLPSKYPVINPD